MLALSKYKNTEKEDINNTSRKSASPSKVIQGPQLGRLVRVQRKYLPLLVLIFMFLGTIIGIWLGEKAEYLKLMVPVALFLMLYPIMVNLKIEALSKVVKTPRFVILAILLNFVVAPLLMSALVYLLLPFGSDFAVGMMILGAVPCGGMLVAFTGLGKGNIALSVIIVTLSLLISIALVPLWVLILAGSYVTVSIEIIAEAVAAMILVPMIAGFITRRFMVSKLGKERFRAIAQTLPNLSLVGLYFMLIIVFSLQGEKALSLPWVWLSLGVITTIFCCIMFAFSLIISMAVGFNYADTVAMGFSTTTRNPAIAITIALTAFAPPCAMAIAIGGNLLLPLIMAIFLKFMPWLKNIFPNPNPSLIQRMEPEPEWVGRKKEKKIEKKIGGNSFGKV